MLTGRVSGMEKRKDMATQVLEVWVTVSEKIPWEQREKGIKNNFYSKWHVQLACQRSKKELVLSWIWILSKETVSCSLSLTVLRGARFHVHLFVCNKIVSKKYWFFPTDFLPLGRSHTLAACSGWQLLQISFLTSCLGQCVPDNWYTKDEDSVAIFSVHHPLVLKQQLFMCRKPGMFPVGSFSLCTAVPHAQYRRSYHGNLQGLNSLLPLLLTCLDHFVFLGLVYLNCR